MNNDADDGPVGSPRVGLFVTCLVDLIRPSVGFAAIKLLEQAGCQVGVPELQTCCGQPAYNSGDLKSTSAIAKQVIDVFQSYEYVVAPSGSCTGMLKKHYPSLFPTNAQWHGKAHTFADRCYELTSFLTDVLGVDQCDARFQARIAYHDSCSGLRELGIREQPRKLLATVREATLSEMSDCDVCCGFGGTFCVKYPQISEHMVADKVANIKKTGANAVLGGDLGCLLNIAGRLKRMGESCRTYHVAEVLADMTDIPAIGESETRS